MAAMGTVTQQGNLELNSLHIKLITAFISIFFI